MSAFRRQRGELVDLAIANDMLTGEEGTKRPCYQDSPIMAISLIKGKS
jgi:hypothetical protein